jgi:hypothetical protein
MRKILTLALLTTTPALIVACGGDGSSGQSSGGDEEGCNACGSDEVCVANLSEGKETDRCVAIPSACGGTASCADSACIGALYDLCEMGWIGVGCSDTAPPTLVSCNPG